MKENESLRQWQLWVCRRFHNDETSRWHWTQRGLVRTKDLLGDHLVMVLRDAVRAGKGDRALARCAHDLRRPLVGYERESRLLIKLADTGRVVQLMERAIETALDLHLRGSPEAKRWRQELRKERKRRAQLYHELLDDGDRLCAELGNEQQQLEVQTLLKFGFTKYGDALTSAERDAIVDAFDMSVRLSRVVVARVPAWFATTKREWSGAQTSYINGGEEACLRNVTVYSTLQHPSVRKFYGACHVGKDQFLIHEPAEEVGSFDFKWRQVLGCARGILYVHEQGLVHENLTASHLLKLKHEDKGVLNGLGLVRSFTTDEPPQAVSDEHVVSVAASQRPSRSNDVMRLGILAIQLLVAGRTNSMRKWINRFETKPLPGTNLYRSKRRILWNSVKKKLFGENENTLLPATKPDFVKTDEWHLLQGMCASTPSNRISMLDVVYQMSILADQEDTPSDLEAPNSCLETVSDVRQYQVASLGRTLGDALDDAVSWCDEADPELIVVQRPVLDRLTDVYEQLLAFTAPLPLRLLDQFSDIIRRFSITLERREDDGYSYSCNFSECSVGLLCASRTIAGRNYGVHYDIDRMLREYSREGLDGSAAVHLCQPSWKELCQRQRQTLETLVEDPSSVLESIESEAERSEVLALLQSEARSTGLRTVGKLNDLPEWFIPPHRIQLGKHLADGSFGAVYEGMFLDSPVVVKLVLTSGLGVVERRQFLQEANLWFSLGHPNLIQLYGACHEEGLLHLHDHGIVHGDLKGNNILVGENYEEVKLADFGLSFTTYQTDSSTAADGGALGAFRWKAPEVLQGGKSTFASDIYSFGMCIIEVVTGKFPWGNLIPDAAVKHNVVEERLLPQQAERFSDKEWELVTRMCCFDPEERITAGAVRRILHELLFSWLAEHALLE